MKREQSSRKRKESVKTLKENRSELRREIIELIEEDLLNLTQEIDFKDVDDLNWEKILPLIARIHGKALHAK